MKKKIMIAAALMGVSAVGAFAGNKADNDSVKVIGLQELQVLGTRASSNTPITYSVVNNLEKQNFGVDVPFLLSSTPSVLTTSDAGAGVGYTTIRLRGTDASRINITTNDIPMNDAESHCIFWVNTPDLASSIQDIQIQRGAGSSTNGAGAFGGSLNMKTQIFKRLPYAEFAGSYGSFNTEKETFKVGTGLLANHFAFDARVSHLASDGYRDRATSSLHSYYLQGGYFSDNTVIKFITFGGKEITYHAWDGISKDQLETDRTYNPNGVIKDDNGKFVGYYDDQTDNYRQNHYQLLGNHYFNNNWTLNVALHYTKGFGYYQEYKNARTLEEYGLKTFYVDGVKYKKSNLVRQKLMDNDFGGGVFSLKFKNEKVDATFGGGVNYYDGDHFGKVIWVKNYVGDLAPDHEYYRNNATKLDANFYAKANYNILYNLSLYADLQYRHIGYKINGENDKWDWTASPAHNQVLNIDEKFDFFNPKAGLFYKIDNNNSVYGSFSVAQKEPTRNNYTDGAFNVHPKSEKLYDYELGYQFNLGRFYAGANFYYMDYTDQLVLNGKINEIGEMMAENVPDSYRMGLELTAGARLLDCLKWDVNATFSRNKIKNYEGYVSDIDQDWNDLYTQTKITKDNTTIAFSPSFMFNSVLSFSKWGFDASLQSQYVSRQYFDNFESKEDSLDPYFVNNLNLAYTFRLPYTKSITLGVTVYNLFNEKYETNGYSYTCAMYENGDKTKPYTLAKSPAFYPMAGTNALGHITIRF